MPPQRRCAAGDPGLGNPPLSAFFALSGGGAPLLSGDLSSPCGRKCRCRQLVFRLPGGADRFTHRVQENIYVRAANRLCRVVKHTLRVVPIGKKGTGEQGKRGRGKGKKHESKSARTRSTSATASATDFTLSM